jgi:RNA recognition motif-containing protein
LYVGNLSYEVSSSDLEAMLSPHGTVETHMDIPRGQEAVPGSVLMQTVFIRLKVTPRGPVTRFGIAGVVTTFTRLRAIQMALAILRTSAFPRGICIPLKVIRTAPAAHLGIASASGLQSWTTGMWYPVDAR